ncbi:unnamed protein product [Vitrella brassicaformis CCMP3155]|uniref:Uncharacterized protein n=1 Tax=Vitrella brassicaformis (strain CCMP3155) TaxID=1169540 RepID=A0A0G4FS59_VITBC|nr:unnamed protein product [Vitrella brassicaformis CCMP3155]|eukprot:CEM17519.1 unnamed protein product [Vitrella brassicaformis CCMP3155]
MDFERFFSNAGTRAVQGELGGEGREAERSLINSEDLAPLPPPARPRAPTPPRWSGFDEESSDDEEEEDNPFEPLEWPSPTPGYSPPPVVLTGFGPNPDGFSIPPPVGCFPRPQRQAPPVPTLTLEEEIEWLIERWTANLSLPSIETPKRGNGGQGQGGDAVMGAFQQQQGQGQGQPNGGGAPAAFMLPPPRREPRYLKTTMAQQARADETKEQLNRIATKWRPKVPFRV